MTYTKTNWSNDTAPAINEDNLNKIEDGIYDAHAKNEELENRINEVNTNLGGKTLWANPNPSADFTEQNITLNSNDYDYYKIYFKITTTLEQIVTCESIKGYGTRILYPTSSAGVIARNINYVNNTNFTISNIIGGAGNNNLIPLYVKGYKN